MPDANSKSFDARNYVTHLTARVGALMAHSFEPFLKKAGITMRMWRVVVVLHFSGSLTLIDISRMIGVKTSTLSRLVNRMIEKRLVSRQRSRHDARTVQISLRRDGEILFHRLWPEAVIFEQLVSETFSAAELERFKQMLQEIETILLRKMEAQKNVPAFKERQRGGPRRQTGGRLVDVRSG
jgi:DNA-binding MarR family transcriptional regulator